MNNLYLLWLAWPEACFRLNAQALEALQRLLHGCGQIVVADDEQTFLARLPEATHAIVWQFHESWFARAPRLRLLATPAAGRELVPVKGPAGVRIHFGGFHGAIIAESVAAFILAWARGFLTEEVRTQLWARTALGGRLFTVAGTHAVIVGYGRIGRAVGAKLQALGLRVSGFSRCNMADFSAAASTADWLILALPSDTGTDNFLDALRIQSLPQRCVIINVGRGNAVDERALCHALETRRLAGAYLDVFAQEPLCASDVLARKLPGLVRMPHCAAFAPNYLGACFQELWEEGLLV